MRASRARERPGQGQKFAPGVFPGVLHADVGLRQSNRLRSMRERKPGLVSPQDVLLCPEWGNLPPRESCVRGADRAAVAAPYCATQPVRASSGWHRAMPVASACAPAKPYRHAGPCADPQPRSPAAARSRLYNPRHPERTVLYRAVAGHLQTRLALTSTGQFDGQGDQHPPPAYVEQAFGFAETSFSQIPGVRHLGSWFCAGVVRGLRA